MKDMLVYDGYMYQFCKPNFGHDYYRCCMSRAVTVATEEQYVKDYIHILS
jgi:hypothetical protein